MTRKEFRNLIDKAERRLPYAEKALERDLILFKWKSNQEGFRLPFQPEGLLTVFGSFGYNKKDKCWVTGKWEETRDDYGDFMTYVCHSLNTGDVKTFELKNHEEVIVCGNTPLYRSFIEERAFYSRFKSETDKSIYCQLLLSRLTKAIVADSDKKATEISNKFEEIKEGYPVVIATSLLENLDMLDLTNPDDIEKMQYLSSFYQNLEKREANDAGIDLDLLDKRAQVSTTEIKQYNDFTTLEYLIMYEMRLNFVEEMKENGFNIEVIKNPVFFDEPKKEDIDEGTFEAEEAKEEHEVNTEPKQEEEGKENGGDEN